MRKLIVLIMTSVLATGAVANADQVTVEKNAGNYINFQGIDAGSGYLASGAVIQPARQTELPSEVNASYSYNLDLEITDDDSAAPLNQVAICLYDSNQLTTPTDVSNECGKGYDLDADNNVTTGTSTSTKRVNRAFLIHYDPNATAGDKIESLRGVHAVTSDDLAGTSINTTSDADIHDLSIEFTINDAAAHSTGWKVRIFAQYRATADPYDLEEIELTSANSYELAYYSELNVDSTGEKLSTTRGGASDGQVNLGTLVQDGSVEKTGIQTGVYRANSASDIKFAATAFQKGSDTALGFSPSGSPSANEFSLSCGPDEVADTNQVFLTAAANSKTFLTGLNDISTDELINHNDSYSAPLHKCILYVGDVPTGTYDNAVTLSIGETL